MRHSKLSRKTKAWGLLGLLALTGCPEAIESARQCDVPGTGCGPFYLGTIGPVFANCFEPDCNVEAGIVCFSCPCNTHDNCYDTCGTDKAECDQAFLDDMLAICRGLEGDCNQGLCIERAFVYAALVSLAGDISFAEGQRGCPDAGKSGIAADLLLSFPFADEDFDFMPDHWETAHGLDPANPDDAAGDPDGDGVVNLGEFLANRDPLTP